MQIHSIMAQNFRPFGLLEEMHLGPLATIVGQNDTGKSNILQALRLFFESTPKIDENDVHNGAAPDDDVVVEVAFTSLPKTIELEKGVSTTLEDEMLLDSNGNLRIRKTYPRSSLTKFSPALIVYDFDDDRFAELCNLKEKELNERCKSLEIDVTKSGRGITNKGKREQLRTKAKQQGISLARREMAMVTKDDLWRILSSLLPEFELFETDTKLGVGETTFQSKFRPIIKTAAKQPDVIEAKSVFTGAITKGLQGEIDEIFKYLQRHTNALEGLTTKPEFSWDKAVTFQIYGKDQHGVDNSLDRRGSGMRRLLMVAFFQYLAEKSHEGSGDFIFAVEEPENCLHPGLQRELVRSFRRLADEGYQIIISSHSPVFAGASPIEDMALVVRETGVARAIQGSDLSLSDVAEQLGVEPADQITGYNACVFVEGYSDLKFWRTVASKLKEAKHVDADFDDKQIGFVLCGGDSLKHWVNLRAMSRLNRHFGVIVDSDRKSPEDNIPPRKLNWKQKCEVQKGVFFISRKREIENYLHPDAIARSSRPLVQYDDFTDMKAVFGDNVFKVIEDMSADEILEMDCYYENDSEHHELKEIVQAFLALAK